MSKSSKGLEVIEACMACLRIDGCSSTCKTVGQSYKFYEKSDIETMLSKRIEAGIFCEYTTPQNLCYLYTPPTHCDGKNKDCEHYKEFLGEGCKELIDTYKEILGKEFEVNK